MLWGTGSNFLSMKILALTPWYLPLLGGIELLLSSLTGPLRRHGVDISVVTDDMGRLPPRENIDNTPVYRLGFTTAVKSGQPGAPLKVLQQMQRILDEERPDILHMHCVTGSGAWYVDRLLKAARFKGRFLVTQHGVLEAIDCMAVIRDLLRRADGITGVSQAALRSALEFSGSDKGRGVIPNGIEIPPLMPAPAMNFTLLCVGRLQKEKGFDLAIEALAKTRAQGLDTILKIVGEGEERRNLEQLALTLGLSDRVQFLGPLDNPSVRRMIGLSHLVLVPSRTREGFSLVAAEAAMAAVPAVAARVGGLPETVLHGETGIVVPPDDPDELDMAICELLGDEPARTRLGAQARRRAVKEFDLARCAERYLAFYRSQPSSNIDQEPAGHVLPDSSQPCLA
jgi:glycogen(starch) synthase